MSEARDNLLSYIASEYSIERDYHLDMLIEEIVEEAVKESKEE